MKIDRLAIAGPDTPVLHQDLINLSKEFPFIEWSILLSKNKMGENRYPSLEWFTEIGKLDLPLSAHFCGWWAREVLENKNYQLITDLPKPFKRVQLNYNFSRSAGYKLEPLIEYFVNHPERAVIFQYNKSNAEVLTKLRHENTLPMNVHFLYDSSGGYGKVIEKIGPTIGDNYTGYAGGLNPENIEAIAQMVISDAEEATVYLDLESGVRTDNEFDLAKVRDVAIKVKKFI